MKNYVKLEIVHAEQWTDIDDPLDNMEHFADEVVEGALGESIRPVYYILPDKGMHEMFQPVNINDWLVYHADGIKVVSNKDFKAQYVTSEKAQALINHADALDALPA